MTEVAGPATRAVRLERRPDGVAVVLLDTPGSKVNVLSRGLLDEIREMLDAIEGDDAIRACVLASAKPDTFIAGADLKLLGSIRDPEQAAQFSRDGHALLDRIAGNPKPFVAAIGGPALGGGLEVALACRYILAADSPETVLALPEVQLGLLPGGGGTQRLPRRVGLVAALPLLLTGKRLRARRALRAGLVDALTSPGGIVDTAARAALGLADGTLRPRRRTRSIADRLLESPLGRWVVFRRARADVARRTRGNYPAPPAILDCVETGWTRGARAGAARESDLFGRLAAGREARNLIGLFDAMTELKKPDRAATPRPVRRVAVLGGGFMGRGIVAVSLPHAPVTVKDVSDDVLSACLLDVRDGLEGRVRSGAISRFDVDRLMARLYPTGDDADLARADLVIEAVFEDLDLKRRVLADVEAVIEPGAVFASNTSALPIGDIAARARHPERVLGMHYFSPVPKMPLLELVVTDRTSDEAIATARAFGVRQGKTVIVVRDGPGFYTSRILSPYLAEATALVREGARIDQVDRELKDFGYPVGPLALLDEVGIDVAVHVATNFGTLYAARGLGGTDAFRRLHEAGASGRKAGRGFYLYDRRRRRGPRPVHEAAYALLGAAPRRDFPPGAIATRTASLMVNEAAHCLDEGVIASPRDGDVGAILGLGFPPFRGGPFRWLDAEGIGAFVERMERLAAEHGPRFEPAPLLRRMAGAGERFYPV